MTSSVGVVVGGRRLGGWNRAQRALLEPLRERRVDPHRVRGESRLHRRRRDARAGLLPEDDDEVVVALLDRPGRLAGRLERCLLRHDREVPLQLGPALHPFAHERSDLAESAALAELPPGSNAYVPSIGRSKIW